VRGNFTSTPLAIGEFAASPTATEAAARWRWFDAVGRAARATNTAVFLWDNGADFLDRRTGAWRDAVAIEVLRAALRGDANSLPDAETDPKAARQWSSATAFKKVGDRVEAQKLPFLLNGNRVLGIAREGGGAALVAGRDYSVGSVDGAGRASITLTAPFLEGAYRGSGAAGVAANLTVRFSRGAASRVQVAQWERPRFMAGGQASSKARAGADLAIPIRWGGVQKVAAVKAVYADGEFLADDWTKYLGPLQAGYATYNNHYGWTAEAVVLKKSVVDMVVAKRKKAVFTFDFFPRVPGNSLTYTLNA
jgi:endoglucanase